MTIGPTTPPAKRLDATLPGEIRTRVAPDRLRDVKRSIDDEKKRLYEILQLYSRSEYIVLNQLLNLCDQLSVVSMREQIDTLRLPCCILHDTLISNFDHLFPVLHFYVVNMI